jgi:hypothetical protein
MVALLDMTILAVATVGALALASAAQWAMLQLALRPMRLASSGASGRGSNAAGGPGPLARAFAGPR